jgi:hypothetical protein
MGKMFEAVKVNCKKGQEKRRGAAVREKSPQIQVERNREFGERGQLAFVAR